MMSATALVPTRQAAEASIGCGVNINDINGFLDNNATYGVLKSGMDPIVPLISIIIVTLLAFINSLKKADKIARARTLGKVAIGIAGAGLLFGIGKIVDNMGWNAVNTGIEQATKDLGP
jgi:hypothetical protein